jgi:hypothetical protein
MKKKADISLKYSPRSFRTGIVNRWLINTMLENNQFHNYQDKRELLTFIGWKSHDSLYYYKRQFLYQYLPNKHSHEYEPPLNHHQKSITILPNEFEELKEQMKQDDYNTHVFFLKYHNLFQYHMNLRKNENQTDKRLFNMIYRKDFIQFPHHQTNSNNKQTTIHHFIQSMIPEFNLNSETRKKIVLCFKEIAEQYVKDINNQLIHSQKGETIRQARDKLISRKLKEDKPIMDQINENKFIQNLYELKKNSSKKEKSQIENTIKKFQRYITLYYITKELTNNSELDLKNDSNINDATFYQVIRKK